MDRLFFKDIKTAFEFTFDRGSLKSQCVLKQFLLLFQPCFCLLVLPGCLIKGILDCG